ncbi:MAG: hypothetical protein R6X25_15350 [Candidatus Krumholzibacteriia bacterium]
MAVESVLGFRLEGGHTLVLAPCIPDEWPGFGIRWRVPGTEAVYDIQVDSGSGCGEAVVKVLLDGAELPVHDGRARIPVARDGARHQVRIELGRRS